MKRGNGYNNPTVYNFFTMIYGVNYLVLVFCLTAVLGGYKKEGRTLLGPPFLFEMKT